MQSIYMIRFATTCTSISKWASTLEIPESANLVQCLLKQNCGEMKFIGQLGTIYGGIANGDPGLVLK